MTIIPTANKILVRSVSRMIGRSEAQREDSPLGYAYALLKACGYSRLTNRVRIRDKEGGRMRVLLQCSLPRRVGLVHVHRREGRRGVWFGLVWCQLRFFPCLERQDWLVFDG